MSSMCSPSPIIRIIVISVIFMTWCLCQALPVPPPTLKRSVQASCYWGSWSGFGDCTNGLMSRERSCMCENTVSSPSLCPAGVSFSESVYCQYLGKGIAEEEGTENDFILETGSNDDVSIVEEYEGSPSINVTVGNDTSQDKPLSFCGWIWGRWSDCTQECGFSPIGNTNRTQQCWCIGMMNPIENETMCTEDHPKWTENVPCNAFPCNGVRPQNKIVWLALYQSEQNGSPMWPLPSDKKFSCSRGDPYHFSNKSWGEILQDPPYEENLSWHYLAKEYIAGRLNKALGSLTSPETIQALEEAQYLLSKCDGYNSDENLHAYITKEKLSRSNNGIGGLSNVDTQMGLTNGDAPGSEVGVFVPPDPYIVVIVVLVFFFVLGVGFFILYKIRQRGVEVTDNERYSYSSDDEDIHDERGIEATF